MLLRYVMDFPNDRSISAIFAVFKFHVVLVLREQRAALLYYNVLKWNASCSILQTIFLTQACGRGIEQSSQQSSKWYRRSAILKFSGFKAHFTL